MKPLRTFERPRFTPIPNEILDDLLPVLDGSEFKVICYIARHTFGWQSLEEGKVLDLQTLSRGVGLSRTTCRRALGALVEAGLIVREEIPGQGASAMEPYAYRILVEAYNEPPSPEPDIEAQAIAEAVAAYAPAGPTFARQLLTACRSVDPEVTVSRLLDLIPAALPPGYVVRSAGFFLTAVPALLRRGSGVQSDPTGGEQF